MARGKHGGRHAEPAWPVKGSRAGFDLFDSSSLETLLIRAWQERLAEQRAQTIARLRPDGGDGAKDGDTR